MSQLSLPLAQRWGTRLKESIKYRAFYAYCNLLRLLKSRRPPHIRWQNQDPNLPRLVAIARDSDMPLLAYSLRTLMHHHKTRPPMWLVGDSDAACTALDYWLPDRPPDIQTFHWRDLLADLSQDYQHFITTWLASGQYGGYAKKFAVTLAANVHADILLVDADVLWFGDFFSTLEHQRQQQPTILSGQDYARTYDSEVAQILSEPRLFRDDPLNCGLVYYPQGILPKHLPAEKLNTLLAYAAQATCHLEQTLIAYAFWQAEGQWFYPQTIATTMSDNFCIRQQVSALVRHYAGGKHLFWRDAY